MMTHSDIAKLLAIASRPVIIAGQGAIASRMQDELRCLVEQTGIPVSHSLLGLGALPSNHPLCLGYHGHTGSQVAGKAIYNSDLLLVLGSRLDVRQVGIVDGGFAPKATIVRVDIDQAELDHSRVPTVYNVQEDLRKFLPMLNRVLDVAPMRNNLDDWYAQITAWREQYQFPILRDKLGMAEVICVLDEFTRGKEVVVATGVGMHQQFVARHFTFDYPRRILLTSGGHGAMGYDLPSAIGAQLAYPDRLVLCVVGDGSFQMNIQELQTVIDYKLPIKIIVLDNSRLGMVSQFQIANWGKDVTCGDKRNPNFANIARAYGIRANTVRSRESLVVNLRKMLAISGPALLNVYVDPAEDISPMLLAGDTLDKMTFYE